MDINFTRKQHAISPTKAHAHDAGFDLHNLEPFTLECAQTLVVPTGVSIALPPGYVGLITGRSSISALGVNASLGIIDAGYRGELKVTLTNHGDRDFLMTKQGRIAQLVIMGLPAVDLYRVASLEPSSDGRGTGGYGSTGR